MSQTTQAYFLYRNRKEFVLAGYEFRHMSLSLSGFSFLISVHHLFRDAPAAQVVPAVAFHSELYATLVADGQLEIGVGIGKLVKCVVLRVIRNLVSRESRKNGLCSASTRAYLFEIGLRSSPVGSGSRQAGTST